MVLRGQRLPGEALSIDAHDPSIEILQAIMDTTPEGVAIVDRALRVLKSNRTFRILLRRPDPETIHGQTFPSLLPDSADAIEDVCNTAWQDGRGDCTLPALGPGHDYATATAVRVTAESEPQARYLLVHVRPREAAEDGAGEGDPSATARSRAQLRESEERFRVLVEGVREYAIVLLDPLGHIVSWNRGAERIHHYKASEIIGRHFSCFYTEDDRLQGKPRANLVEATSQGRYEQEGWRLRRDGTRFWADVAMTALRNERGTLTGFAKVTRDLTDRRLAEEALRRQELAEERERTVWRVLQLAAHEMRNPMTAVLGAVRLLRDTGSGAPEQAMLHTMVEQETLRLERLLAGFADTVVNEGQAPTLDPSSFALTNLSGLVAQATRAHRIAATHEVVFEDHDPSLWVSGHADSLRQVLDNILTNAMKFSPPRSQVFVRMADQGGLAHVSIQDHGVGIPEEDLDRVFDRFVRLPSSTAQPPGLGLGLYVTRQILEAHGGRIWLTSEGGTGCTVHIELPLATHR